MAAIDYQVYEWFCVSRALRHPWDNRSPLYIARCKAYETICDLIQNAENERLRNNAIELAAIQGYEIPVDLRGL